MLFDEMFGDRVPRKLLRLGVNRVLEIGNNGIRVRAQRVLKFPVVVPRSEEEGSGC